MEGFRAWVGLLAGCPLFVLSWFFLIGFASSMRTAMHDPGPAGLLAMTNWIWPGVMVAGIFLVILGFWAWAKWVLPWAGFAGLGKGRRALVEEEVEPLC